MKTGTKVWLMIAAFLVLLGGILFAGVMTSLSWDFLGLATTEYETNTYEISEAFDAISMHTDTADIAFVLSNDGACRVVCHEEVNAKHSVAVNDGTLTVEGVDEQSVYDFIGSVGLNFGAPKITVYLPKTEYASLVIDEDTGDIQIAGDFQFGDVDISLSTGEVSWFASVANLLKIKASTGDIRVENMAAGSIDLSVSTGRTKLINVTCKNLISRGDTGDASLQNVIAEESFLIERSTGDVTFDRCDAGEIFVTTDTGDVTGSLLTEKVFLAQTDTGKVDVPQTATGGKCEITTDTGNIHITIA